MTIKAKPQSDNRFGDLIHAARLREGWTMAEVARRASLRSGRRFHTTTIARYEAGQGVPDLEQALTLLNLLEIPFAALVEPAVTSPWIDGSRDTLERLEDAVAGRTYVEVTDLATGAREVEVREDPDAALGELPEIPEEDR